MDILIIVIMIIVPFILYELATMSPLRWHPPHIVDNTDGPRDQHWQQTVLVFLDFYLSVHKFAYLSANLCNYGSLCNSSQIFKNSFLRGCQWPLKHKMIETQWLTLGKWGGPLHNDPKLVMGQSNSTQKNPTAVSKHLGVLPSFSICFEVWCCLMVLWNVMVSSLV